LPLALGYYGFCGLGAVALAAASREEMSGRSGESAAIGTVQATALGLGFLFVTLSHSVLGGLDALLFGTFLGISAGQVMALLAVCIAVLALVAAGGRALLFSSVDQELARAGGVPVPALGFGFLLVLGLAGGGDDKSASERAATNGTKAQKQPRRNRGGRRRAAPAPVKGVTVRVAPSTPTYACMDTGEGTPVVFEGILEQPRTFRNANRLRVNLGKRAVDLRVNGKRVQIAPSPEPVGFDLTPKGATELPVGRRPCA
jgi:hypothetical protein